MDFVIDLIYVGDGDAIIIWGRKQGERDEVIFLDGGDKGNGEKIVAHYEKWIKPNLTPNSRLGFINSHPHADHINGLIEVVEKLGSAFSYGIYNDPVECITEDHKEKIHQSYLKKEDPDIVHLYEEFEQIQRLNDLCSKNGISRYDAYADQGKMFGGAIEFLSPYKDFYVNLVQYFSDVEFLKAVDFSTQYQTGVDEAFENLSPCKIVDEIDDTTPENLTSTIIQLTDSQNRRYIITGDAGVESFNYVESEGHNLSGATWVQLPHHGSRRNISARWVQKFSPTMFLVSAVGDTKHPRKAVINCIKRNIPGCKVYSTHTSGKVISYTTDESKFPNRGWSPAQEL